MSADDAEPAPLAAAAGPTPVPAPAGPTPVSARDYALHGGLLLATLLTTTLHGAFLSGVDPARPGLAGWLDPGWLLRGLVFSVPLLAILLAHELGHYVAARYHRVDASLPYFIPVPLLGAGTFGAFMRIRSAIPHRRALLDIGIAGPLAGLVVAVPVLIVGLGLSPTRVQDLSGAREVFQEGQSLLYGLLKLAVLGEWLPRSTPEGVRDVALHPAAYAGWLGLLLTMINLIPIAQLDGGHILYAWIGERHRQVTDWLHRALFLLGAAVVSVVAWQARGKGFWPALGLGAQAGGGWLVLGTLIAVFRRIGEPYHPPVPPDGSPERLGPGRTALAALALVLFVLLFLPAPFRKIAG